MLASFFRASILLAVIPLFSFAQEILTASTSEELRSIFSQPVYDKVIQLASSAYDLQPINGIDSTCGNCLEQNTFVEMTYGLQISGKNIRILGAEDKSTVINTHAGYGIFINNCESCSIENLTVTGGERDTNGNATDAAIVVKNSSATIRNNKIVNNIGDSILVQKKIVGIMGICGRENSKILIENDEILRNSWDGIALYRDATAAIRNNIVDGVDKARGNFIGGGRGVAIGVTWNGKATIENNLVRRYWKGIGLFVDANGIIRNNIIEDIITWGISLWDAEKGKPVGIIENNIIYNTGACGVSITSTTENNPGRLSGNIITLTGQNPKYDSPDYYCYQCALAQHSIPKDFEIENNYFYNNRRATDDLPDYDVSKEEFYTAIIPLCKKYFSHPVFRDVTFLNEMNLQK
ncbi:MAG: right-handed parallel beta-helix repeat-containing protein [Bacteroidota bacterium]